MHNALWSYIAVASCSHLAIHSDSQGKQTVVQLAAADAREGLRPGSGCSAVLRRLAETHPDGAFIGAPEVVARGARGPHDAFALAKELWEGGADLVVVDDVDILSGSTTIYSNRFSSQGESHGFNKTSAEPTILVKALTDYAVARGKRLVFRSVEDQ